MHHVTTKKHYTQDTTKHFITHFIELILNNNYFQFCQLNYIETLGIAIGTKIASTYVTVT